MTMWANNLGTNVAFDDGLQDRFGDAEDDESYEDSGSDTDSVDPEERWADAEVVQEFEVDDEGRRFEVIKKVRRYHVDRPLTAADLRARFTHFGKGLRDQKTLVSKEPPLALEMGTVDEYERKSRDEVKRLIFETSTLDVKVNDPRLAIVDKEERIRKQQKEGQAASSPTEGNSAGAATWGGSRNTTKKTMRDEDPDVSRRVRITNLSDNITETNLRNIFGVDGMEVDRVFLPSDKVTGKVLGYAFLTFREQWMAERALSKNSIKFKNVVLHVCKAIAKRD